MDSITLSDLAQRIKDALSNQLAGSYWVVAEIGEMKVNARGHCYLELVEKNQQQVAAKLRAAIWAYDFRNINQWFSKITGQPLREGIKILANAQVSFHEVYGLNLTIRDIDPNFTLGEREKKKQEVIARLTSEGLLDQNKRHELPLVPQKIAVVSSSTAAGYEDFCHQLQSNKNRYAVACELFHVTLQGREAAASIIAALTQISSAPAKYDAVVIIRGGGAQMDFDAFNEYLVCATIAQMPYPVLTGIGHERDETIADMVAHTKLKTPTAVAGFILDGFRSFAESVYWLAGRLQQAVDGEVTRQKHGLQQIRKDLYYLVRHWVREEFSMQLELKKSLLNSVRWLSEKQKLQMRDVARQLVHSATDVRARQSSSLSDLETRIKANDPQRLLEKGFTITKVGGVSISKAKIKTGEKVVTYHARGTIQSEISKIDNNG